MGTTIDAGSRQMIAGHNTAISGATFSPCQSYRYCLWRIWDISKPKVLFIGLNPSTADSTSNDPTIRRCIGFAKHWGYGGIYVANLFSWRSPHPKVLKKIKNPIGVETDAWLLKLHRETHLTIACWGNNGNLNQRGTNVITLIPRLYSIHVTKKGNPAHPLYLPKQLFLKVFHPN